MSHNQIDAVAIGFDFSAKVFKPFAEHTKLMRLDAVEAKALLSKKWPAIPFILLEHSLLKNLTLCRNLRAVAKKQGATFRVALDDKDAIGWLEALFKEEKRPRNKDKAKKAKPKAKKRVAVAAAAPAEVEVIDEVALEPEADEVERVDDGESPSEPSDSSIEDTIPFYDREEDGAAFSTHSTLAPPRRGSVIIPIVSSGMGRTFIGEGEPGDRFGNFSGPVRVYPHPSR